MADDTNRLYLCQAQIGPMANFVYFIGDKVTHKAAVVDPAWDVDKIIDFAAERGLHDRQDPDHALPSRPSRRLDDGPKHPGCCRNPQASQGQGLRQ